jgi:hypothetical protein
MKDEEQTKEEKLATEVDNYFEKEQEDVVENKADQQSTNEKKALFSYNGDFTDIDIWIKHEEFRLRVKEFNLKKQNEDSERILREKNAVLAFKFSAVWACFIGIIILLHAMFLYFKLTETEFLTVIGALTTSILIYYLFVIKYLFYRPKI